MAPAGDGGGAAAPAPKPTLPGILPKIPRRHEGLPTYLDMPQEFRDKVKDKTKKKTPYARLFCFYGIGDSAGQWLRDFVNDGADWCEMAVFEYKAHGTREGEPFDETYEERAEDVWEALRPALEQQAAGGKAEGAPWAILSHSAGIVPMCMLAARARAEFGLEPTAVFVVDQAPPDTPFLNDLGYEMMRRGAPSEQDSSFEWMSVWQPHIARMKGKNELGDAIYRRWSIGMRFLQDFYTRCEGPSLHKFSCPLYVVVGTPPFVQDARYDAGELQGDEKKHYEVIKSIRAVREEDHYKWRDWTDGPCEFLEVDADHGSIWYHPDTQLKLWQEFLGLSGVAEILHGS